MTLLIILTLFILNESYAQLKAIELFFFSGDIDFDNVEHNEYFSFEGDENMWQIGAPRKTLFIIE